MNSNSHIYNTNFFINNVDKMIIPNPKPMKDESHFEDIMNYCHSKYRNILPNKINYNFDSKAFLFPFEKTQIVELLTQIETCIQLIIQVKILKSAFY